MSSNINKLLSTWINNSNGITGPDSSMYSLRNDGKTYLGDNLVMAKLPEFSGATGTIVLDNNFITKQYADSHYSSGGTGAYMDLTTNQQAAGIKTFTDTLIAKGNTGSVADTFQAYKSLTQGDSGYIKVTSAGKLSYQNTSTSSETWSVDPFGNAILPIIKNTSANTNYLEMGNNGLIGYFNTTSGGRQGYRYKLDQSTNSYTFFNAGGLWNKCWTVTNQYLNYYNLGGNNSISMDGNNGTYTAIGTISTSGGLSVGATATFSTIPICTASYTGVTGNSLITKAYADANYSGGGGFSGYVDLTSNQNVGGVKNFTSNLRAHSASGDVFQAFKNSGVGNDGHVLINSSGDLLYYDTTASAVKWNLKSDGSAIISGTCDFSTIPICTSSYASGVTGTSLITQSYADSRYHPVGDYVTLDTTQTITGEKSYTTLINCTAGFTGVTGTSLITKGFSDLNYVKLTGNEDVGGVKNFTSNLRAHGVTGDVFQAFKNTSGSTGHILINGDAKLLYWDESTTTTKWSLDNVGYGTAVRYNVSPTSPDTNVLSTFPTSGQIMNDNALLFRGNTDIQHYIKYVNYNTNAVGGRLDGLWCQGYAGGVLASSTSTYSTQAHFQWKSGNNYSLVPLTISKPSSGTLANIFTATRNYTGTGGGTGYISIDNNCKMVFNNGLADLINIDTSGGEITAGTLSANVINSYNSIINEGTFVNDNGIWVNSGTIYNDAFATYASTASIPTTQSGSTINLALTATGQIFTLPTLSTSQFGIWFYITGSDNYTATIKAATGEYIYNGTAFVNSITIGINETIWIGVKTFVSYSQAWNYFKFCQSPATTQYVDASFVNLTTNQNITAGIKQFYQPPLIGCGAQNGRLVRIGYQVGTYMTDSNATVIAIGNDIANSNSAAMNQLYLTTIIGSFACQYLAPTTTKNSINAYGAYALRNIIQSGNDAFGTYSGQNLLYGTNNAFFGTSSGAGLIGSLTGGTSCDRNFIMGNQSVAGSGRVPFLKTTYGGATQTSATITFTSNLTGIYAGCQIYFFSAATSGNNSVIETVTAYNQGTFTVTLANSQTILGGSFVALYSVGEPSYTNTITTGGTGTTFTLDNTNANITAGQLVSYAESASPLIYKYTTVSSWNNTTKVLVVAATITIHSGSTLTFRTTGTIYQNRGLSMSDNCTVGTGALMNSGTNCSRNVAIGTGAANGVGNIVNYDNRTYFNGQDNICIGYGAGATTMFQDANRNIFIGAASGQNGYAINCYGRILTETCGIGYGVNTWDNYQYVFGKEANYYYFPTSYKMVLGVGPNINSSRTTSYETGYPGMLQIVCTNQLVGNVAIACKAFTDTANIINFMNNTGAIRGGIVGASSSTVSYITTSDRRKKDNIEDMPSQLENIKKVKPRKFKWKDSGEDDNGFIAQEFYEVYPERNPLRFNDKYDDKLNPDDYIHGMDYGRMTPYLWKGMTELIDIVKKQQEEINLLKVDLANLRQTL